MGFHPHVEKIKEYYLKIFTDDKMCGIAQKLTAPANKDDLPSLEKMWKSVQKAAEKRYELHDHMWAHNFVSAVFHASNPPPYFYKNRKEQKELVSEIERSAKRLSRILEENQLDFQLIHTPSGMFKGFAFYEGFSEANRARIDRDKVDKLKMSVLLPYLAAQATEEISYSYTKGKTGKRVKETRFIRFLAKNNTMVYGSPHYAIIAAAAFAVYGVEYSESDIANLVSGRKKPEDKKQLIKRLAALKPSEYALVRGSYADSFHVHVTALDEAVQKARQNKKKPPRTL